MKCREKIMQLTELQPWTGSPSPPALCPSWVLHTFISAPTLQLPWCDLSAAVIMRGLLAVLGLVLLRLARVRGQAFWLPDQALVINLPAPVLDGIGIFHTARPAVVITGTVASAPVQGCRSSEGIRGSSVNGASS